MVLICFFYIIVYYAAAFVGAFMLEKGRYWQGVFKLLKVKIDNQAKKAVKA